MHEQGCLFERRSKSQTCRPVSWRFHGSSRAGPRRPTRAGRGIRSFHPRVTWLREPTPVWWKPSYRCSFTGGRRENWSSLTTRIVASTQHTGPLGPATSSVRWKYRLRTWNPASPTRRPMSQRGTWRRHTTMSASCTESEETLIRQSSVWSRPSRRIPITALSDALSGRLSRPKRPPPMSTAPGGFGGSGGSSLAGPSGRGQVNQS